MSIEITFGKISFLGIAIIIIFLILNITGWIYYFISLKYLKRKLNLFDFTSYGPLIYLNGYKNVKPEGQKYAKRSMNFLGGSIFLFLASIALHLLFRNIY